MHLLCYVFFVKTAFNFSFIPKNLPGRLNDTADALSHNNLSPTPLQANALEQQPIDGFSFDKGSVHYLITQDIWAVLVPVRNELNSCVDSLVCYYAWRK